MYPRDAILVGMEDLSGKGGTVASGFSLFQQLGGWHLNLNCWVSSGVCERVCVSIPPFRQDTRFIGSGAHPIAVWSDLN